MSASIVLLIDRHREGRFYPHRTIFSAPLASLGIPLAALWHPRDTPASASIFASPAEAAQRTPGPSFWSSRLPQTLILELSPACRACFHFSSRPVFLPFWITFGTPDPCFWDPKTIHQDLSGIRKVSLWVPWPPFGPFSILLGSL